MRSPATSGFFHLTFGLLRAPGETKRHVDLSAENHFYVYAAFIGA